MKAYYSVCFLVSLALSDTIPTTDTEYTIAYPADKEACNDGNGNHVIPKPTLPFTSEEDVADWLKKNQMCYFLFVNDYASAQYPAILAQVTDDNSKICWGPESCEDPNDALIVADINTLKDYVDIKSQTYTVTEVKQYSFKVEGKRKVKLEDGLGSVAGFLSGEAIENKFAEEYTFNPEQRTLEKRNMKTEGGLAQELLKAGLIKYAHFARSVGQIIDFPHWYGDEKGDDVYYVQINQYVAIGVLMVVVGLTLVTLCWSCKLMKECLCKDKQVHRYGRVKPVQIDTTDISDME